MNGIGNTVAHRTAGIYTLHPRIIQFPQCRKKNGTERGSIRFLSVRQRVAAFIKRQLLLEAENAVTGSEMLADSVLTDITKLKAENQNLQYLNDTTPCAFLKYTC